MRWLILYMWLMLAALPVQAKITVAVIAPKAGLYQKQGAEITRGAQKAIDEINESGGLRKEKIELLSIDDQCSNSIAISTAQMLSILKSRKIGAVIGPYCSNSFAEAAQIYARAKIFQIIPTTVNAAHAQTIHKGLIKMLGYTSQQAQDFFNFYNTHFAGLNVAVVSNISDADSMAEASEIAAQFQSHGKSILLRSYTYDMTKKDYDKLAEKIIENGADMAFLLGSAGNIKKTALALKKIRADFAVFTNKYAAGSVYFDYMGDRANGTYFLELRGNDDPDFAEILVQLRLSGFETDGLSLYGYAAVELWAGLVKKSGSFDYDKLSAAVKNKKIHTVSGDKFFHNGAPKTNESYAIYLYKNGTYDKVY